MRRCYALVVGKNGSKLKESEVKEGGQRNRIMRMGGPGKLDAEGVGLDLLAHVLSERARPAGAGSHGAHREFRFRTAVDSGCGAIWGLSLGAAASGRGRATAPDPNGPSIFTAVQEQLGLRLESQKGPVDLIVTDGVEKPFENYVVELVFLALGLSAAGNHGLVKFGGLPVPGATVTVTCVGQDLHRNHGPTGRVLLRRSSRRRVRDRNRNAGVPKGTPGAESRRRVPNGN